MDLSQQDDLRPFRDLGTTFVRPIAELEQRAQGIRAVLFDWDGVFNDGVKDLDGGSPFSEVGSMGVNMLRFGLWLEHEERMPIAAIITGQHNRFAEKFAAREHLHALYMGFTNKVDAFEHLLSTHGLRPEEVAFFFDDAIDLAVAQRCGLRVLMRQQAASLFAQHAIASGRVDIATALSGGENGLREATELVLALVRQYHTAIEHRGQFTADYQRYLAQRNTTVPAVVGRKD